MTVQLLHLLDTHRGMQVAQAIVIAEVVVFLYRDRCGVMPLQIGEGHAVGAEDPRTVVREAWSAVRIIPPSPAVMTFRG